MKIEKAINDLKELYSTACDNLRSALNDFTQNGTIPDKAARAQGLFCYPELIVRYHDDKLVPQISRSFGKFSDHGTYSTTVTQPEFFESYLREQLEPLLKDYEVELEVRPSRVEIPYPYVWDAEQGEGLDMSLAAEIARWFPTPQLSTIGDEVADGDFFDVEGIKPLSLFDAPRVDFSLQRLKHYTGTPVEHFQSYVLFTNYHRYIDSFAEWAVERLKQDDKYESLSAAGGVEVTAR